MLFHYCMDPFSTWMCHKCNVDDDLCIRLSPRWPFIISMPTLESALSIHIHAMSSDRIEEHLYQVELNCKEIVWESLDSFICSYMKMYWSQYPVVTVKCHRYTANTIEGMVLIMGEVVNLYGKLYTCIKVNYSNFYKCK